MISRYLCITLTLALSAGFMSDARSASSTRLMALYTFNGTLADASGNGRTAKDSGTPTYVTGAPFGGKAISFDGLGKAIVTAPLDIGPKATPAITFGAWVRARDVSSPQYGIISNDEGNYDRTLGVDSRSATTGANWSAFVGGAVVGKVPAVPNKWVFLAVSFEGGSTGTYAFYTNDGAGTAAVTGKDAFDSNGETKVTIGRNPNFDNPFKGDVANAFFYRGVLTRAQIDAIVAKGPTAIPGY